MLKITLQVIDLKKIQSWVILFSPILKDRFSNSFTLSLGANLLGISSFSQEVHDDIRRQELFFVSVCLLHHFSTSKILYERVSSTAVEP